MTKAHIPDPFARDAFSLDTINIAHVRVAGLGGIGLVLVCVAIAVEFKLVAAVSIAGLAGGALCGAAMILYRGHRARPLDVIHLH